MKYKLLDQKYGALVIRTSDEAFIPFDPGNTDYQAFREEVLEGAELQDADGNVMTPEQAQAFIASLPDNNTGGA